MLGKALDYLIINRINHHLYSNNILHRNQFGFTPESSTTHTIMNTMNFIYRKWEEGYHLFLTSLDIKGAFDNLWWPAVLANLKKYNCPRNLFLILNSYLQNRQAGIFNPNTRIVKSISRGCPQGSRSGPSLWNILFNEVFNSCDSLNNKTLK